MFLQREPYLKSLMVLVSDNVRIVNRVILHYILRTSLLRVREFDDLLFLRGANYSISQSTFRDDFSIWSTNENVLNKKILFSHYDGQNFITFYFT